MTKTIEFRNPIELKPYDFGNAVIEVSQKDYNNLKSDIEVSGKVRMPVEITKDNKVVVGRSRVKIGQELNLNEVPVVILDILEDEYIEYAIRDNLMRRHYTMYERIAQVVQLRDHMKKEGLERRINCLLQYDGKGEKIGSTNEQLAKLACCSEATITQALYIMDNSPELWKEIVSGKKSINAAHKELTSESNKPANKSNFSFILPTLYKNIIKKYKDDIQKALDHHIHKRYGEFIELAKREQELEAEKKKLSEALKQAATDKKNQKIAKSATADDACGSVSVDGEVKIESGKSDQ